MSTFDAKVSCGTPSRSASIAGTTPVLASVDSDPKITRSNPVCLQRLREHQRRHQRIGPGQRLID